MGPLQAVMCLLRSLVATVQLGMIAYESNSVVQWDEGTSQIPNNPAAAELLKRDYRAPYVHP